MPGILSYGAYVPHHRLQRAAIGAALQTMGGKGTRAVASYDEDTTSMGVEAARAALAAAPDGVAPDAVLFATAEPAYLDKTNATAIHAALALDESAAAYDLLGSVRSGIGALRLALDRGRPTLVVTADIRTGLPGGSDELSGGDATAALLVGDGPDVVAELVATASSSAEFLDRWRSPGAPASKQWEERFGETAYVPLAEAAITEALKGAGVGAEELDHVVVTGLHARAVRRIAAGIGARPEAYADLTAAVGNTGTAHLALALADVLDRAEPGQVVLAVSVADGADAFVLRTTDALARFAPRATVAEQIAGGSDALPYATFLTWRGVLQREPARRPDPDAPAAPPSFRTEHWKFAFVASRCDECGTRHLPPQRVCVRCDAVDRMSREPLADTSATIATYTVDRLAFTLNPPVVAAVVDFDDGGRFQCEMTDVDASEVRIGDRVELTFRRLFTAGNGVRNYFWKARPQRRSS